MEFEERRGNNHAETVVKFQGDRIIINTNLAAMKLLEIMR